MQNLKLLFAVIGGTLLLVLGASWFFSWQTQSAMEKAQQVVEEGKLVPVDAHIRGTAGTSGASESAQFTIVEFSDFQCPACKAMHSPLTTLLAQHADRVRLVYRHFPLNSIHKNAYAAAKASEAAGDDKFWEMHDRLFATQEEWAGLGDPTEFFVELATGIGLDEATFREHFKSEEVAFKVNRDQQLAAELGVAATPTFYLNGQKMDLVQIQQVLAQAAAAQTGSQADAQAE